MREDNDRLAPSRREFLAYSSAATLGATGIGTVAGSTNQGGANTASHHPGPPRFTAVGEEVRAPELHGVSGNLAPWNPDPSADFSWSVVDRPAGSTATIGDDPVVNFAPDVPGTYTLRLDTANASHDLTVRAFPSADTSIGRPKIDLYGDVDGNEVVLTPDVRSAPDSEYDDSEVTVEYYVDDRDDLARDALTVADDGTARIPVSELSETTRIHAVAAAERHSAADYVRLEDTGKRHPEVVRPNATPEWVKDATVYEIFTRRFEEDMSFAALEDRLPYLADLGVDAIWLTPILKADSTSGEWVHGYDITNYFETDPGLGSLAEFKSLVDACHDHGIRVLFDLVVNHSAREHRFFQQAAAKPSSKYHDWYLWEDGEAQYYYGWQGIPNFNYYSLGLRQFVLSVVDFWSDIVDGFRCDVAWGIPHSFWKEVRDLVKAKDEDFLLLDETIPADADYGEAEFDIHFDSTLYRTLKDAPSNATSVLDVPRAHRTNGFPDHAQFLQYIENHDVERFIEIAGRDAQKAAAGATFTLPGTPMIYYGQERGLDEYRETMRWEDYDEELLSFYRDLTDARENVAALQHQASLRGVWWESDSDDVVAYGRSRPDYRGADGDVAVVLNFGADPATVTLADRIEPTNLLDGSSIETEGPHTTVTVEDVAVLPTNGFSDLGKPIATWDDPKDDDVGPGGYTYPKADVFSDGLYDLISLDVHRTDDAYQFHARFAGELEDATPATLPHLQFYLRDPDADSGSRAGRVGTNVQFEAPYQQRLVVDGASATLESANGDVLETDLPTTVDEAIDGIRVEVPEQHLEGFGSLEFVPLVCSRAPDEPGHVRPVEATATGTTFGGGAAGDANPNVVDTLAPVGSTQSETLAYGENSQATLPYLTIESGIRNQRGIGEKIASWDDPAGDDHGPGSYTYPTADAFRDGAFDLTGFEVYESEQSYTFRYQIRGDVVNPWDSGRGFSFQNLQLYLRDPDANGGTTDARTGVNARFTKPYHYRLMATGWSGTVENAAGDAIAGLSAGVKDGLDGIWVTVSKTAFDGDIRDYELVPLLLGQDGWGPGKVRPVVAERGGYVFGGGRDDSMDPNVLDLITPDGTTQAEALAYSGDRRATIPLLRFSSGQIS